jgi:hypothetical protein
MRDIHQRPPPNLDRAASGRSQRHADSRVVEEIWVTSLIVVGLGGNEAARARALDSAVAGGAASR